MGLRLSLAILDSPLFAKRLNLPNAPAAQLLSLENQTGPIRFCTIQLSHRWTSCPIAALLAPWVLAPGRPGDVMRSDDLKFTKNICEKPRFGTAFAV
jgi:hypothetical protein